MKVIVDFKQDGSIRAVKNIEKYNLSDDVTEVASRENKRLGYCKYGVKEIPSDLDDIICFLLGDKGYKIYGDLETIEDSMNNLSDNLDSISSDIFHMVSDMENIEKLFKELVANHKDGL